MKHLSLTERQQGIVITALFRYEMDLKKRLLQMDLSNETKKDVTVKINEITSSILPKLGDEEE